MWALRLLTCAVRLPSPVPWPDGVPVWTADELQAQIDAEAQAYRSDPSLTYETAVGIALACGGAVDDPEVGEAARILRAAFGAWVRDIEAYGSGGSREAAVAGHDSIERALDDWLGGGRADLIGFAQRWQSADGVGSVDRLPERDES